MKEKRKRTGGRSERVQKAVLRAALDLYSLGEPIPSMLVIAQKAGVQKTTLYRRWGSAEALLHAAISQEPAQAIPVPDTGTLWGDLTTLAKAGHGFASTVEGRSSSAMLYHATETSKREYWARRYSDLQPVFTRAMERGELPESAPWQIYLDVIIGTTYFASSLKGDPLSLGGLLNSVNRICGKPPS